MTLEPNIEARDQNGFTPLMKAASIGRFKMVKAMVEAGADPRLTDPLGKNAVDQARFHNNLTTLYYLEKVLQEEKDGKRKFVDFNNLE